MAIGVSGSRDVSSLRCDFGRHVSPDVSSLILNLKSKHLISGAASNLHDVVKLMPTLRWVPRTYTVRFFLRIFEQFQSMEFFDDNAMFMYGQMLSAISSDSLDTDEIFTSASINDKK